MISSSRISYAASSRPAITGDTRYRALPAREVRPLAFVYSSLVSRSVIVALKAGSGRAEKQALTKTPAQICHRAAPPLFIQNRM